MFSPISLTLFKKDSLIHKLFRRKYIIGIDLGSTNSCVAVLEEEGQKPRIIENSEGARITPSIVSFTSTGIVVGMSAKRQAASNLGNTFFSIKRLMGKQFDDIDLQKDRELMSFEIVKGKTGEVLCLDKQGGEHSPKELSAQILKKMKEISETYLGEEINDCVLTIPSYFNEIEKQSTIDACKIINLNVKTLIQEPIAAALAYGFEFEEKGNILVYDFGGGTFDVTILVIEDGKINFLATNGNSSLGGQDFDNTFIEYLKVDFFRQTKIEIKFDDFLVIQRLREMAEIVKIELSTRQSTEVNLPFLAADKSGPKHLNLTITRAQYEKIMEPLWKATFDSVEIALQDANISSHDIKHVICSGGMTKMPRIQQALREYFNLEPVKSINPDEVVALGAAYKAFEFDKIKRNINISEINPLSIGVEILGGLFHRVIERNSKLPIKTEYIFSTALNDQTEVSINLYQGERELVQDNKFLGSLKIENLPSCPQGQLKLKIKFKMDEQGIIHIKYVPEEYQNTIELKKKVEAQSSLTEDEIKNHLSKSKENILGDTEKRKNQQIENMANQSLWTVEKLLLDNLEILPEKILFLSKEIVNTIKFYKSKKQFDRLIEQTERLDRVGKEILEILMKCNFENLK